MSTTSHPPDSGPMRAAAAVLLRPDALLPRSDELAECTGRLRRYLRQLLPMVEDAARELPEGSGSRAAALLAVENARASLAVGPGPGLVSATRYARGLARAARALCATYEALTGPRVGDPA